MPISGYSYGEVLSRGSETVVWRARRGSDGLAVVIKAPVSDSPPPEVLARLRREHDVARALPVDGVVPVLERVALGDALAVVMADLAAPSLDRARQGGGAFDPATAVRIGAQAARILGDVHDHGVIHKDVTPANLVYDATAQRTWLIDFGLATRLAGEETGDAARDGVVGTPAYMPPEQTGRMNRSVDHRADLYGLGASLFELLAGRPPFTDTERLSLVHDHVAVAPPALDALAPDVPASLARIVARLLAKTPETRYQSAPAVARDLETCLAYLDDGRPVPAIAVGDGDIPLTLRIPETLYGREAQVEQLTRALDDAAAGARVLASVGGPAGVGKSALVEDLRAPATARGALVARGKFDHLGGEQPYTGLIQAFTDAAGRLLTESQAALADWRDRLQAALGRNARVITDLVPAFTGVLGAQPALPALDAQAERDRFRESLRRFLAELARPEQPLVLVLDDLQWADTASVELLRTLVADPDLGHVLIVATHRDDALAPGHPLHRLRQDAERAAVCTTIALTGLDHADTGRLIADTLATTPDACADLARAAHARTGGNPFFLTELLRRWYADGAIRPDSAAGCWRWDNTAIAASAASDNVIGLLDDRLAAQPPATQRLISRAAVLGQRFDLAHLAVIAEQPATNVLDDLWPALDDGLLVAMDTAYKLIGEPGHDGHAMLAFLHDRVREAALARLSDADMRTAQLTAGRLLVADIAQPDTDDRLFAAVNHLNAVHDRLADDAERQQLAHLNLTAGRRAKTAGASAMARAMFENGIQVLADDGWHAAYRTMLDLHQGAAETAYLSGDMDGMHAYVGRVRARAARLGDTAHVRKVRIEAYHAAGETAAAIDEGLAALREFGMPLSASPSAATILREMHKTKRLVDRQGLDPSHFRQAIADPNVYGLISIADATSLPLFLAESKAFPVMIFRTTRLLLHHGMHPAAPSQLAVYALLVTLTGGGFRRPRKMPVAYAVADLVQNLFHPDGTQQYQARAANVLSSMIQGTRLNFADCVEEAYRSYQMSVETADHQASLTSFFSFLEFACASGHQISYILSTYPQALREMRKTRQYGFMQYIYISYHFVHNMKCYTKKNGEIASPYIGPFSEQYFSEYRASKLFRQRNLNLALIYDDIDIMRNMLNPNNQTIEMVQALVEDAMERCVRVAAAARLHVRQQSPTSLRLILRVARDLHAVKRVHADFAYKNNVAANYRYARGAVARALGFPALALRHLSKAMDIADHEGQRLLAALSRETAGDLYYWRGDRSMAALYLAAAMRVYAGWGADGKVRDIRQRYSDVLPAGNHGPRTAAGPMPEVAPAAADESGPLAADRTATGDGHAAHGRAGPTTLGAAGLDVEAMMRAVQTISEAIEPDRLIANLMHVVAATGGASLGHLLTDRDGDGQWLAQARIDTAAEPQVTVLDGVPLAPGDEALPRVPLSVVRYVERTGEAAIAADATQDSRFAHDRYVRQHQTRSILCVPLVHRGRSVGILYLENAATAGVFTEARGRMLSMLSTQMAIAMENARLYGRMQQEVAARTQELERQSRELERTNHAFEDSITYASFLQNALLPDDDTLAGLGEHAVIWWPRDVVGGDIYVARRSATGVLAGVIDCTGHGVPGAFMSMAAYAAFDYAIEETGGASPAQVLQAMDAYLRRVLARGIDSTTDDGLEIGLLHIEPARARATFAGAGIDLFLADAASAAARDGAGTSASVGNTVQRIRAAKAGLGYRRRKARLDAPDHAVPLPPNRCLYIASDGVLDQVGGAKRLSFGRKRLEHALAASAALGMTQQRHAIARALTEWKGDESQRDDITVLALRPIPAEDGPTPGRASATGSAAAPTASASWL